MEILRSGRNLVTKASSLVHAPIRRGGRRLVSKVSSLRGVWVAADKAPTDDANKDVADPLHALELRWRRTYKNCKMWARFFGFFFCVSMLLGRRLLALAQVAGMLTVVYLERTWIFGYFFTRMLETVMPGRGFLVGSIRLKLYLNYGDVRGSVWRFADSATRRLVFGIDMRDCYVENIFEEAAKEKAEAIVMCQQVNFEISCEMSLAALNKAILKWREPKSEAVPAGMCIRLDNLHINGAFARLEMSSGELNLRRYDRRKGERIVRDALQIERGGRIPNILEFHVQTYKRGRRKKQEVAPAPLDDIMAPFVATPKKKTMFAEPAKKESALVHPIIVMAVREDRSSTAPRDNIAVGGVAAWDEHFHFTLPDLWAVLHVEVVCTSSRCALGRFDARICHLVQLAAKNDSEEYVTVSPLKCDKLGFKHGAQLRWKHGEKRQRRESSSMICDVTDTGCVTIKAVLKLRDVAGDERLENGSSIAVILKIWTTAAFLLPDSEAISQRRRETALFQFRTRLKETKLLRSSLQQKQLAANKAPVRFDVRHCDITDVQAKFSDMFSGREGVHERHNHPEGDHEEHGHHSGITRLINYVSLGEALRSNQNGYSDCADIGLSSAELSHALEGKLMEHVSAVSLTNVALSAAVEGLTGRLRGIFHHEHEHKKPETPPAAYLVDEEKADEAAPLSPVTRIMSVGRRRPSSTEEDDDDFMETKRVQSKQQLWGFYGDNDNMPLKVSNSRKTIRILRLRSQAMRLVEPRRRYLNDLDNDRIISEVKRGVQPQLQGFFKISWIKSSTSHWNMFQRQTMPELVYLQIRGLTLFYTRRYCPSASKFYGTTSIGFTKKIELRWVQFAIYDALHNTILLRRCAKKRTFVISTKYADSDDVKRLWHFIEPVVKRFGKKQCSKQQALPDRLPFFSQAVSPSRPSLPSQGASQEAAPSPPNVGFFNSPVLPSQERTPPPNAAFFNNPVLSSQEEKSPSPLPPPKPASSNNTPIPSKERRTPKPPPPKPASSTNKRVVGPIKEEKKSFFSTVKFKSPAASSPVPKIMRRSYTGASFINRKTASKRGSGCDFDKEMVANLQTPLHRLKKKQSPAWGPGQKPNSKGTFFSSRRSKDDC